ncbi:Phytanoyl-CoA dioxygenase (PhyH) [Aquisphaera giovannonii]|uniref:Phytanoyl-CoA dioxygenase (PhyH) n=1 Tax=Aquisphaera giovannonii TaxID=406548 RepID=A0A5B9WDM6_9BACT|nr:phytanoyl-CoA dioxygenase family protein [Aquisphaera giovannonii]QEH38553.1 Phytanoyl-CoA dioxygenase (PhyH) [Aquisphaera giovannonii]
MGRRLSAADVARFEEDGVLFPVAALDPGPLAAFRSGFESVMEALGDDRRPERFGQWHLCFRWAYDLVTHPPILDAVEDLLGPDILVHSASAFAKRPGSPEFVSWHQDGYNWELDVPRLASAWVALTDSTPENGCLRVVPGSHRRSRLDHLARHHEHNMLGSGLQVADEVVESQAVDVALRAGEMSFHHVDIVHGSGPNRSRGPRIGFAIRYTTPGVSQRRSHHEVVLARGSDRHARFDVRAAPPSGSIADGWSAQRALAGRMSEAQVPSSRRAEK